RAFRKIEPDYNKEGKRDRFAARQPKMEPTGTYAFSGYKAPPVTDPDAPAVEVLAAAAGTGKTGFLFRYLRETDGAGYESGAVYPKRLGPSVAALLARSPNDARVMRDRLSALWKQTIDGSPEDLRRARLRAVHNHQAQRQTMRDRAYWLAFRETAGVGAEDEWTTRLAAVTDEQLKACANRWFSGAPAVVP
ncbi:MAG: insulinase family protein, partial [Armatimonadetes bacterium]|nr:insulinase family protein [Armatimonadota bacterium]